MIAGKKILAVIPARGGSKGVPRKNIRLMGGRPLVAWTIEEAKKSKYIDRLVLSSEDDEVIRVAKEWGCDVPFKRPAELAQDDTPGVEPVLHALQNLPEYDYVVLLQPTSPLRSIADIDGCIDKCVCSDTGFCVTVTEPDESPYWMYRLDADGCLCPLLAAKPVTRRQDLPTVYALNGAVYVAEREGLFRERSFLPQGTLGYEMPRDRSLDIDTEEDVRLFEITLSAPLK